MISAKPYNTWPLQVKIFTEEAAKYWTECSVTAKSKKSILVADPLALPFGCIHTVELEGVDGKSGKTGSGRIGPICVKDGDPDLIEFWPTFTRFCSAIFFHAPGKT
jgi:structure-specific endonuclease subunit SLX1